MLDIFGDWATAHPWVIYVFVALGPFVQEDAAILSAAAASAAGAGSPQGLFISLIIGLSFSDLWKYWLGRIGHRTKFIRKFAANERVIAARENVVRRLGLSLITARFVPGTRVPLYIACGIFRAPFPKVAFFVISSAIVYSLIAFSLFHLIGEVAGDYIESYAPIVAISLIVVLIVYFSILYLRRRARMKTEEEDAAIVED